jgi:hypothetical protein
MPLLPTMPIFFNTTNLIFFRTNQIDRRSFAQFLNQTIRKKLKYSDITSNID